MSTQNEKPILMNSEMVKAILEGRKTQTRRVIKKQPIKVIDSWSFDVEINEKVIYENWPHYLRESSGKQKAASGELTPIKVKCPHGEPGNRLWVRESGKVVLYKKSSNIITLEYCDGNMWTGGYPERLKWTPRVTHRVPNGVFKEASRITLEITDIRVDKLMSLGYNDAIKEGFDSIESFKNLWDTLNKKRGFSCESNPWVWILDFKKV